MANTKAKIMPSYPNRRNNKTVGKSLPHKLEIGSSLLVVAL